MLHQYCGLFLSAGFIHCHFTRAGLPSVPTKSNALALLALWSGCPEEWIGENKASLLISCGEQLTSKMLISKAINGRVTELSSIITSFCVVRLPALLPPESRVAGHMCARPANLATVVIITTRNEHPQGVYIYAFPSFVLN